MNTWVEDYAKFIADESLKLVKAVASPKSEAIVKKLSRQFLGFYVESLVYDSLMEYKIKNLKGEKAYQYSLQELAQVKTDIQDQIAKAFENSFKRYAGQFVEYYVQIKVVPEPKNKEVC